jgi:hypothetical protein
MLFLLYGFKENIEKLSFSFSFFAQEDEIPSDNVTTTIKVIYFIIIN